MIGERKVETKKEKMKSKLWIIFHSLVIQNIISLIIFFPTAEIICITNGDMAIFSKKKDRKGHVSTKK